MMIGSIPRDTPGPVRVTWGARTYTHSYLADLDVIALTCTGVPAWVDPIQFLGPGPLTDEDFYLATFDHLRVLGFEIVAGTLREVDPATFDQTALEQVQA